MPLGELLEAGAWYAEHGVPVTSRLHASLKSQAAIYAKNPDAAAVFLPNGEIPPVGGVLRQPGLARSLNRIADGGRDAFYGGDLAAQMVDSINARTAASSPSKTSPTTRPTRSPRSRSTTGATPSTSSRPSPRASSS